MLSLSPLSLGAIFLLAGLLGYFLVSQLVDHFSKSDRNPKTVYEANLPVHLPNHYEAYFLVEPGGKVIHSNSEVKDLFTLNGGNISLEVLASGVNPKESFFALCAKEGKARFTLGNNLIEGKSYQVPHNSSSSMLVSFREIQLCRNNQFSKRRYRLA